MADLLAQTVPEGVQCAENLLCYLTRVAASLGVTGVGMPSQATALGTDLHRARMEAPASTGRGARTGSAGAQVAHVVDVAAAGRVDAGDALGARAVLALQAGAHVADVHDDRLLPAVRGVPAARHLLILVVQRVAGPAARGRGHSAASSRL